MTAVLPRTWLVRAVPVIALALVAANGKFVSDRADFADGLAGSGVLDVHSNADRGPGSLREALFLVMTADRRMRIRLHVAELLLENPLPKIKVAKGVEISGVGSEPTHLRLAAEWVGDRSILNLTGDDITLVNLSIDADGRNGIRLDGAHSTIERVHVENAKIGLEQANIDRAQIRQSRFENNRIAVRIGGEGGVATLTNNTFLNNAESAIWIVFSRTRVDSEPVRLVENRIRGGRQAIVLGNTNSWVTNNDLAGHKMSGITVLSAAATIRDNVLSDSDGVGIRLQSPHDSLIDGNDIGNHKLVGLLFVDPERLVVSNNRFYSNTYGMAAVGRRTMQARIINNDFLAQRVDGVVSIGLSPVIANNRLVSNGRAAIRLLNLLIYDEPPVTAVPHLASNEVHSNGLDSIAYGVYRVPES